MSADSAVAPVSGSQPAATGLQMATPALITLMMEAIQDGNQDGMQCFDGEFEKLVWEGKVELRTALQYATNEGNLRLMLADCETEPAPDAA